MTVVRKKNRPPLKQGDSYVEELESSLPKDKYGKILYKDKDLYPELYRKIEDAYAKKDYDAASKYNDEIKMRDALKYLDRYKQFTHKNTPYWKRDLLLEKEATEDNRKTDRILDSLDVRNILSHNFNRYVNENKDASFDDIKRLERDYGDTNSSMDYLAARTKALNNLAQKLYPGTPSLKYDNNVELNTSGVYRPFTKTVSLRKDSSPSTTLHEIIHAASDSKNAIDINPELNRKHSDGHNIITKQKASPDINSYDFKTGEFDKDVLTSPTKLLDDYASPHFGGYDMFKDKVYETFDSGTLDRSKIDRFAKLKKLLKGQQE